MVSSPVLYLDEALTIAGSGFPAGESVAVFILGTGVPAVFLGFTDADANGAWVMSWDMLSAKVVSGNAGALAAADVLTISAEGSKGSNATIPVMAIAGSAPTALSVGASLNLRPPVVAQGGTIAVAGSGYGPREIVNIFVISGFVEGVPMRDAFDRGAASNGGAFSKDVTVNLEPGVYTIEGFGESDTVATGALVVTAGAK